MTAAGTATGLRWRPCTRLPLIALGGLALLGAIGGGLVRLGWPLPSSAGLVAFHGPLMAFAFDAGEGLSGHTAPFDALVMMIEGESEISIAGTPHRLIAGHVLRLPAGQPHAIKAVTQFKMILIMIRASAADADHHGGTR